MFKKKMQQLKMTDQSFAYSLEHSHPKRKHTKRAGR